MRSDVGRDEGKGVVARHEQRRLRQIVCAKREEVGRACQRRRDERGARRLDHGADFEVHNGTALAHHILCHRTHEADLVPQLALKRNERHHDLELHSSADVDGRLDQGAHLHCRDVGRSDAHAAAAMAEHRIVLGELADAQIDRGRRRAESRGEREHLRRAGRWQKLVQRRIEQAHRHRRAGRSGAKDCGKVAALHRQQPRERAGARRRVRREDHLAHHVDAFAGVQHVLGARQSNAARTEEHALPHH
jgi:hypothetical protein